MSGIRRYREVFKRPYLGSYTVMLSGVETEHARLANFIQNYRVGSRIVFNAAAGKEP